MTTRNKARRRKGATRQVDKAFSPERRCWVHPDRAEAEAWVLCERSEHVRDYWQRHAGTATYVYFVVAVGLPEVKVGYAANPITRLGELQCGNARELVIESLILGSKATEHALHDFWREAHVRGEWFGKGYEHAIVALANTIGGQQIKDHKGGCDLLYLRDTLPAQVLGAQSEAVAYAELLAECLAAEEADAA